MPLLKSAAIRKYWLLGIGPAAPKTASKRIDEIDFIAYADFQEFRQFFSDNDSRQHLFAVAALCARVKRTIRSSFLFLLFDFHLSIGQQTVPDLPMIPRSRRLVVPQAR